MVEELGPLFIAMTLSEGEDSIMERTRSIDICR
jgi:hypothetical protein